MSDSFALYWTGKNTDQDESGHRIWVAGKEAAYIMYKVCVIQSQTPVVLPLFCV